MTRRLEKELSLLLADEIILETAINKIRENKKYSGLEDEDLTDIAFDKALDLIIQ